MRQRVAILNFAGCNNYGANLTALALLRQCERLDCRARLVDRRFAYEFQENASVFNAFCRRYFRWTSPCYGVEYAKKLNRSFDAFIVGSDQVWAYRPDWTRAELVTQRALYDLEFAAPGKHRIAMAASFGGEQYTDVPADFVEKRSRALKQFCGISVREASGVDICQRCLGVDAKHVMDPVFFLSAQEWGDLAGRDRSKLPSSYVATCILEEVFNPVLEQILQLLGGDGTPCPAVNTMRGSVEAWVRTIRDASFVVTDSFHVTCFAIIFRKPFLYLNPTSRGTERVPSMLSDLELTFPCIPQKEACCATEGQLQELVAKARSAAYTQNFETCLAQRIGETCEFLRSSLFDAPVPDAPAIPVDLAAKKREFRRWNPFRFSVPKRFIRRSAMYDMFQAFRSK